MELSDKCIIVTGGAQGLGLAIVENLIQQGCKVAILDKNPDMLGALKESGDVLALKCDITKEYEIQAALDQVLLNFPRIHGLVNNAGILHSEPMLSMFSPQGRHSLQTWNDVINVNLTAPFLLASYVVEHMVKHRTNGVIINISSISACGNPGQTAYSASKAGLEAMTKVWAKELGPIGIRSVAVAPGFMDMPSTAKALSANILANIKQRIPIRRLGNPELIAEAVTFAFKNDYINGSIIKVDGGLVL